MRLPTALLQHFFPSPLDEFFPVAQVTVALGWIRADETFYSLLLPAVCVCVRARVFLFAVCSGESESVSLSLF